MEADQELIPNTSEHLALALMSRYNVQLKFKPTGEDPNVPCDYDQWLKARTEIFEQFTFPSLRSQTNDDFMWIVLFDADRTPNWLKEKIDEWAMWENFIPGYIEGEFEESKVKEVLASALRGKNHCPVRWVGTGWMDTDDVISPTYIEHLRSIPLVQPGGLCFPKGYRVSIDYMRDRWEPGTEPHFQLRDSREVKIINSPKQSTAILRIERGDMDVPPNTVYEYPHSNLVDHVAVTDIRENEFHFIKIIHGNAVVNRTEKWFQKM